MQPIWQEEAARKLFADHGLSTLDQLCAYEGGELITTARTRALRRIQLGDDCFYVKTQELSPKRLPLRKYPSYLFKGSPLTREAHALDALGALGLRVPQLIASGEERRAGLPRRAVLITRELPKHLNLVRYLAACEEKALRLRACDFAEQLLRSLHKRGYVLLGAKYRNLLVPTAGPQTPEEIALVDQPSFRETRSERLRNKDLRLLLQDRQRYGRLG